MSCKDECPDNLQLLTVSANAIGETEEVTEDVDALCKGARVYSHTLSAVWGGSLIDDGEALPDIDSIAAILSIGGTEWRLPSYGCKVSSIRADLPGLCVSASVKLIAQPGFLVYWHVNYGNCK